LHAVTHWDSQTPLQAHSHLNWITGTARLVHIMKEDQPTLASGLLDARDASLASTVV
jgi:hypothetical protein